MLSKTYAACGTNSSNVLSVSYYSFAVREEVARYKCMECLTWFVVELDLIDRLGQPYSIMCKLKWRFNKHEKDFVGQGQTVFCDTLTNSSNNAVCVVS